MGMDDDGEQDDKVIAVPTEDPRYDEVQDIEDVDDHLKEEIEHFFETYKALEPGKETEALGFEGKEAAKEAIERSLEIYEEKFE
jgi:inorganic pyrophosphatase